VAASKTVVPSKSGQSADRRTATTLENSAKNNANNAPHFSIRRLLWWVSLCGICLAIPMWIPSGILIGSTSSVGERYYSKSPALGPPR
jgi:hypothetical protein